MSRENAPLSLSSKRLSTFFFLGLCGLLIGVGLYRGWLLRWLGDDAFLSFRYALHLVEGKGLVFNAGEVVEGYTNFLWTVWMALPLALGVSVEMWAHFWSLASFGISLGLLAWLSWQRWQAQGLALVGPIALFGMIGHQEALIYATSGLETALYTCLLLGSFTLLGSEDPRSSRFFWAGIVGAAAFLTRPDGAIFVVLAGIFLLLRWRGFERPVVHFGLAAFLPSLLFLGWRLQTYGDIVPNTYYAKSANLPWYSQGWTYVSLYLVQYWPAMIGLPLFLIVAVFLWKRLEPAWKAGRTLLLWQGGLAFVFSVVYTFYVIRVGGDFMYGRFLIPVLPFALLCLEGTLGFLFRPFVQMLLGVGLFVFLLLSPSPLPKQGFAHGIADEWTFYQDIEPSVGMEWKGTALRPYFEGLPIRIAFVGSQARLVYHARPSVAIESITGLTDATIARLPLTKRTRIGHEKNAPPWYLLDERKTHLIFFPPQVLLLEKEVQALPIHFPSPIGRIAGHVLVWEPSVMKELQRRGAILPDVRAFLDERFLEAASLPYDAIKQAYRGAWRLYFRQQPDPERQAEWEELLLKKKQKPAPLFERPVSRPALKRPASQPAFGRPSSRPTNLLSPATSRRALPAKSIRFILTPSHTQRSSL